MLLFTLLMHFLNRVDGNQLCRWGVGWIDTSASYWRQRVSLVNKKLGLGRGF